MSDADLSAEGLNSERSVTVYINQKYVLSGDGFIRALSVSPEKLSVYVMDKNTLILEGRYLGYSFVHVWTDSGLMTLKVTIAIPKDIEGINTRKTRQEGDSPFRPFVFEVHPSFSYSNRGDTFFDSKNPVYRAQGIVRAQGGTPYGDMNLSVDYIYNLSQDVVNSNINKIKFRLQDKNYNIEAGNIFIRANELTLPLVFLQGIRMLYKFPLDPQSGSKRRPVYFDRPNQDYMIITAGASGNKLFGDSNLTYPPISPYFYGVEYGKYLNNYKHFVKTEVYISQQDKVKQNFMNIGQEYADFVVDVSDTYSLNRNLDIIAEAAFTQKAFAAKAGIKGNWTTWALSSSLRFYDKDFRTVVGNISYQGQQGLYNVISYRPWDFFKYTGNLNFYRQTYQPNPDKPNYINMALNNMFAFDFMPYADLDFYYNQSDLRGTLLANQSSSFSANLHRPFAIGKYIERFDPFLSYEVSSMQNPSSKTRRDSYAVGASLAYLQICKASARLSFGTFDNIAGGSSDDRVSVDFDHQINAFIDDKEHYSISHDLHYTMFDYTGSDYSDFHTGVGLEYRPSEATTVMGSVDLGMGKTNGQKYQYSRVYVSCRHKFDSGIVMYPSVDIKAVVFMDENANGEFDEGDIPIEGAKLVMEYRKSTERETIEEETGKTGSFDFGRVKCSSLKVTFDDDRFSKYSFTTQNSFRLVLERRNKPKICYFGLYGPFKIRGRVYNDVNVNGMYDEGIDIGLRNVRLMCGPSRAAFTDSSGKFFLDRIKEGKYKFFLARQTLPYGYTPSKATSFEVEGKTGDVVELDIPLVAIRSVSGIVFLDNNGNGLRDLGDERAQGVDLDLGNEMTATNSKGFYMFKNIPGGGTFKLCVDEDSIPDGYSAPDPVDLEISAGPNVYSGIDIAIPKET